HAKPNGQSKDSDFEHSIVSPRRNIKTAFSRLEHSNLKRILKTSPVTEDSPSFAVRVQCTTRWRAIENCKVVSLNFAGASQTSGERVLAKIEALLDFVHRVHSAAVIVFDVGYDGILFPFQQLKNLFDRHIAGSPRYFAALPTQSVANVQHWNLLVL